ncbi:hypothetical protein B7H23_15655 [Notoacmeibacter marinus]|uniref:Uncharacterized protein n=1 Tax=Notoacmeibacter marinus TaxID=1876515 RepID=A0A231UW49_9HYPH|nr:hypothetical protein [Notoacmeibacter marinus]OXS99565.1 hypothetical protein B7H23_15655 [Notoacmeibacter marinus]
MSFVDVSEIARNIGLVILAAAGIWFTSRQYVRARRRDEFALFAKASEMMRSANADVQFDGYLMMRYLEASPDVAELAKAAAADYIEAVDTDMVERIEEAT